jgi:2,4-dienoyl-CoA reductase-like NADH-dependent reductase (Old Yellow Enzyme family)
VTVPTPFDALSFSRGPSMPNRIMLAPLTNLQSHDDGTLSEDEFRWLTLRAHGGFGSVMTCASHVQAVGKGFSGQLGIFADQHLEGLTRLAKEIRANGSVALAQLHHAGMRSPKEEIGTTPVCPSENAETGARGLSLVETEALVEDFVAAAVRAERAGFDGVELHGAHGYVICQYLSAEINQRDDRYGGNLENRARLLFEIIEGVRARCRPDFTLGVRLSAERFGITMTESVAVAERLCAEGQIDFLDMSLWDVSKEPAEEVHQGRDLLSYFTAIERGEVRLGVAGKIASGADVRRCLDAGVDFVLLGRAGILHHDFPKRLAETRDFETVATPVSADYLREQGLGEKFVGYMSSWHGFVEAPRQ